MRVPAFSKFHRLMQNTAVFICGLIVGSAVATAMMNDQFDLVVKDNIRLRTELETIKQDRKQDGQIQKRNVIKSIIPQLEAVLNTTQLDTITEGEIKKRLKRDLDIFIGRSIYDIDTDAPLARRLLQKKLYDSIADKTYEINIKTMLVVDGVLRVWVEVREHLPQ